MMFDIGNSMEYMEYLYYKTISVFEKLYSAEIATKHIVFHMFNQETIESHQLEKSDEFNVLGILKVCVITNKSNDAKLHVIHLMATSDENDKPIITLRINFPVFKDNPDITIKIENDEQDVQATSPEAFAKRVNKDEADAYYYQLGAIMGELVPWNFEFDK